MEPEKRDDHKEQTGTSSCAFTSNEKSGTACGNPRYTEKIKDETASAFAENYARAEAACRQSGSIYSMTGQRPI